VSLAKSSSGKPVFLVSHVVSEGVNSCMPPMAVYKNTFELTWALPWEQFLTGVAFI